MVLAGEPARGSRAWLWLIGALFAEYALLAVAFDVAHWLRHVQLEELRFVRHLGPAFLTGLVATLVVGGKALRDDLQSTFEDAGGVPRRRLWLALHACAFGALFGLSAYMFRPPFPDRSQAMLLICAWLGLGSLAFLLLLCALTPLGKLLALIGRNRKPLALGAVMAAVAHQAGDAAERLWEHTARPMLDMLAGLASVFLPIVYYPDERVLGTDRFLVHIGAECSGFEGVGLITIFIGGYIVVFRERLRISAALWVLALGMATMWITNLLRIVTLLVVGHFVSQDLAVDGFHANLGWLLFLLVALSLVTWLDRSPRFWKANSVPPPAPSPSRPLHPVTAYLAPQLLLILCSLVTALVAAGVDWLYGLRIAVAGFALWAWRSVLPALRWAPEWRPVALGIGVFVMWLALVPRGAPNAESLAALEAAPASSRILWIAIRALGSTLIVPVVEELAFRGYLLRRLQAASFLDVPLDRFALGPVVLSSLAFGLLHEQWIAGTLAGIAFAYAQAQRGRIGDAVVAHAVTNGLIAVAVLFADRWDLWM